MSNTSIMASPFYLLMTEKLGEGEHLMSLAMRRSLALAATPADMKTCVADSMFDLGIDVEKQLDSARKVRGTLEIMRNFQAPTLSMIDATSNGVEWPSYSMDNYAADVRALAEKYQIAMTMTFYEGAVQIVTLAQRMKESVTEVLDLLAKRAKAEEFRQPISHLKRASERGKAIVTDLQTHIATLNRELNDLRTKATTLQNGYAPIIPKLEQEYDTWAKAHGRQSCGDLKTNLAALEIDIAKLQAEIEEKERGMIAAGSVGSATVIFFFLCTVACAIAIGVMGNQRKDLLQKTEELKDRARILQGAVAVSTFIESCGKDIERMKTLLDLLEQSINDVWKGFDIIYGRFAEMQTKTDDELQDIEDMLAPSAKEVKTLLASLDTICEIADHYRKYAIEVKAQPATVTVVRA